MWNNVSAQPRTPVRALPRVAAWGSSVLRKHIGSHQQGKLGNPTNLGNLGNAAGAARSNFFRGVHRRVNFVGRCADAITTAAFRGGASNPALPWRGDPTVSCPPVQRGFRSQFSLRPVG